MRLALRRHLPEGLQALVVRDVLLTLRFFSFGVVLHFMGALLCLAVMMNLLPEVRDDARAVQVVTGMTTAFGVACLALLTPRLLKFQLPYWWLERSTSMPADFIWRAKIWHANVISLIFPLVVALCSGLHASNVPGTGRSGAYRASANGHPGGFIRGSLGF